MYLNIYFNMYNFQPKSGKDKKTSIGHMVTAVTM